jgi:hypothetical protein
MREAIKDVVHLMREAIEGTIRGPSRGN